MADSGWTVFAGVRKDSDGDELKRTVAGDVRPLLLDVTDADQIAAAVAAFGEGGLDALVNNAGVSEGGPIEALTDQDWRWHFDVNVFGLVNLTRECLPLLRQSRGRVVNIGSIGGRVAAPGMAPYSAGKHAVEAISESLRFEVEPFGMKVACVEPGSIATAIWSKADGQLAAVANRVDIETQRRYGHVVDILTGFVADGAKRGIPPAKVAAAVHHALTSTRPKHRYLVGTDAKIVGVVSRLPDRLRYRVMALNGAQMARAGRRIRSGAEPPAG